MTIEQSIATNEMILEDVFPDYTNQFLTPFKDIVNTNVKNGVVLDFELGLGNNKKINPIIKLAKSKDAEEIVKIYKDVYRGSYPYKENEDVEFVRSSIQSKENQWLLFKDVHDNTMGCFTFVLDFKGKKGYIRGLMVKRKYQGKFDLRKAVLGSYISMYSMYESKIMVWWAENRTAHSKSQYAFSIGGVRPIAFFPNKDIFHKKVESDILHVCYDEKALRKYRTRDCPRILPSVIDCFKYSNARYYLGPYNIIDPKLLLDGSQLVELSERITRKEVEDEFGYKTIKLSFKGSDSYFRFLYTPSVQNFEKTEYKVDSLEELFVFLNEFKKCGRKHNIRYCECHVSAYEPKHQKIFSEFGLDPRGYIPSWNYNNESGKFEDCILFNYFEGEIDEKIQLIPEGLELLETLNLTPKLR